MKLSVWAKSQGISYLTAYRAWQKGALPVPAYQMASGRIIVDLERTGPFYGTDANTKAPRENVSEGGVALYARVSGHGQKEDMDRQAERLRAHAESQGWAISRETREIGSGLNGHRPSLIKLLADPDVKTIVVEHRDRLARFGAEYIEAALAANGRRIVVLDETEQQDDLVHDMIDVLTSFCARIYGKRSANLRAMAAAAGAHAQPAQEEAQASAGRKKRRA